jgi:hypothetical protein
VRIKNINYICNMNVETELNLPEHEKVKRDLANKFTATSSYLGAFVKSEIMNTNFKGLRGVQRPCKIKKGDVITAYEGTKARPAVVIKVLKDGTVMYIPLTSTDNIHCMSPSSSRFFGEGCFTKSINVCSKEYALEYFVGIYDNMKALNLAIKSIKEFININL